MIDQLIGRPSGTTKRVQVVLVMLFWVIQLRWRNGPPALRRLGKPLSKPYTVLGYIWADRKIARFTPWQIVVGTSMAMYVMKNLNSLLGFSCMLLYFSDVIQLTRCVAPEPLARLVSILSSPHKVHNKQVVL